jgi:hypothetical protein
MPTTMTEEPRDRFGFTKEQNKSRLMALPDTASDEEKRYAAHSLLKLTSRLDSFDGSAINSGKPIDTGSEFYDRMKGALIAGKQALETPASKAWREIADEDERFNHASERLGFFKRNIKQPIVHATTEHDRPLSDEDMRLLPDLADDEKEIAGRFQKQYAFQNDTEGSDFYDEAELGKPISDEERGKLNAAKDKASRRRVIAEYDARMRAENVYLEYETVKDQFSPAGDALVREVFSSGDTPANFEERFKALDKKEQPLVSQIVFNARHTAKDGAWFSAGRQFLAQAYDIPKDALNYVVGDTARRLAVDDKFYNEWAQTRALLNEAIGYKPGDFGEWGDALVGTAATLPYMGYSMLPKVGGPLVAAKTAADFEARVAAEGGDVTSLDFMVMNYAGAIASTAIERVQAGTFAGIPGAMKKRVMFLGALKSVKKSIGVAGQLTKETGKQLAEEVAQRYVEESVVAYGLDKDMAREAMAGAIQEARDSGLTMAILSGVGVAQKGVRINFQKKYSVEETISAAMHAERLRRGDALSKDAQDNHAILGELFDVWYKAGNSKDHVLKEFRRIGFTPQETAYINDAFTARFRTIMESDKITPEQKREMIGHDTDPRSWLRAAMPDAEITEGPNGGFSYTRKANGIAHSVSVEFYDGGAFDMTTPQAAASIVSALDGAGVTMTPEAWLALTPEEKQGYVQDNSLRKDGWFTPVDTKNGVTEGSLNVLAGTIHLDRAAHPATLFHEHFHGFARMLKDTGVMTPSDIAQAQTEFGPAQVAGEDFNEEKAAPAFQGFVAGKINPPATSVLRHIYNALATVLNAVRGRKAQTTEAATIREVMFEQALAGNFTGIPVSTVASTEAARQLSTVDSSNRKTPTKTGVSQNQLGNLPSSSGAKVTATAAPIVPIARYRVGESVTGTRTARDGSKGKGRAGTVREVTQNADGSFAYKVDWDNGTAMTHPESFFFGQPTTPAAQPQPLQPPAPAVTPPAPAKAPTASQEILRTPTEWESVTGIRVIDPDGWRGVGGRSWEEPITEAEWDKRVSVSTIEHQKAAPPLAKPDAPGKDRGGISFKPVQEAAAKEEAAKVEAIKGKKGRFESTTPDGSIKVSGYYAVTPLEGPITSDMPGYNPDFQGRDRNNIASRVQVDKGARNIQPARLFESPETDGGAPILTSGMNVLSGNGRMMMLRQAQRLGKLDDYDRWVREKAAQLGIDIPAGIQHPVLVRVIDSTTDTAQLARISELSNRSRVLARNPAEVAEADATTIMDSGLLALFNPDANGNMFAASNRDFMSGFIRAANDDSLTDSEGKPTDATGDRVRRAMLAIIASRGPDARNVIRALVEESRAVGMSRTVDGVTKAAGELVTLADIKPAFSILDELALALREFMQFKVDGAVNVREWVGQAALFGPARPAILDKLIIEMGTRSGTGIYAMLKAYTEKARAIDTGTGDMFGSPATTKEQVLDLAIKETAESGERLSVSASRKAAREKNLALAHKMEVQHEYDNAEKQARERFSEGESDQPSTYAGKPVTHAPDEPGVRAYAERHAVLRERRDRGEAAISGQAARLKADNRATDQQRNDWSGVSYSYSLADSKEFDALAEYADGLGLELIPVRSEAFDVAQDGDSLFVTNTEAAETAISQHLFRVAYEHGSDSARALREKVNTGSPAFKAYNAFHESAYRSFGAPAPTYSETITDICASLFAADGDVLYPLIDGHVLKDVFTDPDAAAQDVIGILDDIDSGAADVYSTPERMPDHPTLSLNSRYSVSAQGSIPKGKTVFGLLNDGDMESQIANSTVKHETLSWAGSPLAAKRWRYKDGVLLSWADLTPEESNAITDHLKDRYNATPELVSEPNHQAIRYSVSASESKAWTTALNMYASGELDTSKPITVLNGTPRILQACGAEDLPITITKQALDHSREKREDGTHNVELRELRMLQAVLDDPIAVFKSTQHGDSIVVLTEIMDGDKNAIVAIHMDVQEGDRKANAIRSIYGRKEFSLKNQMEQGLSLYVNTKKARALFQSSGLVMPGERNVRGRDHKVFTEQDFNIEPPASNVNREPPAPRNAMSATRGQFSHETHLVAAAAARILAGKDVQPDHFDRLAKVLETGLTGAQIIERAKLYTVGAIADEAKAALKGKDPTAGIIAIAKQVELDNMARGVKRGAKLQGRVSALGQKAIDNAEKKIIENARGANLQELVVDTGIDLTATIMNADPKHFSEEPGQDQGAAGADKEPEGATIEEIAREATPEELADRAKRNQNLIEMVRNWWATERARREKLAAERAAEGAAQTDEEAEAEQEADATIVAIPKELLEAAGVDLSNAREVAHLIRMWIGGYIIEHSEGRVTPKNVWKDSESIERYRKTVVQQLRDMAQKLVDPIDMALPRIMEDIGNITNGLTPNDIEWWSVRVIKSIQRNGIRQSQAKMISAIDADIKKLARDGKKLDPLKQDIKRKVSGEVEALARMIPKIIRMSPKKLAEETDITIAEMKGIEQAYADSDNPESEVELDAKWHVLHAKLQLMNQWGGLKYKMPAEIAQAHRDIVTWLTSERDRLEKIATESVEIDQGTIDDLLGGMIPDNPDQHDRPVEEGVLDKLRELSTSQIEQRLKYFIRHSKGEKRKKAEAAIERIAILFHEARTAYQLTLDQYAREDAELLVEVSGGNFKDFLRTMTEPISEEDARALDKGQKFGTGRNRLTRGQAIQLLLEVEQGSYARNVAEHGRQDDARRIRALLTAAELKLVTGLRRIAAERRIPLSEVVQQITGIPIWNPDPNYWKAYILQSQHTGFSEGGRTFTALAGPLTPRIAHKRDFDESVNVIDALNQTREIAARAIGYGERGIHIRNILGSKKIKQAIVMYHGKAALSNMTKHVMDAMTGVEEEGGLPKDISRFIGSVSAHTTLAWSVPVAMKQMAGLVQWANVLEAREVIECMKEFNLDDMREFMESDEFKARYGGGVAQEMREAFQGEFELRLSRPSQFKAVNFAKQARDLKGLQLIRSFYRAGMKFQQFADMIPSLAVGVGLYKAKRDALTAGGMDYAAAAKRAATITGMAIEKSQQSSRPENQPAALRRHGAMARLFFQYASATILQYSHEYYAAMEFKAGVEGSGKKLARVLFINHVIIPNVMMLINTGWKKLLGDDDDDELLTEMLIGMLLGPASRLFFISNMAEGALRSALGARQYGDGMVPAANVLNMAKYPASLIHDLITLDFDKAQEDLLKMIQSTGAPQRHIIKAWKNYAE